MCAKISEEYGVKFFDLRFHFQESKSEVYFMKNTHVLDKFFNLTP